MALVVTCETCGSEHLADIYCVATPRCRAKSRLRAIIRRRIQTGRTK